MNTFGELLSHNSFNDMPHEKFILVFFLLFYILLCSCSGDKPKQTIHFKPLNTAHFNFSADSSFAVPQGKIWEERRRLHDSCMGESFAVNAVFIKTKDSFRLGAVVNMKTMKVVKDFDIRSLPVGMFGSAFSFMTKPCYEKRQMDISPASFVNEKIMISIPDANETINKELNDVFYNSVYAQVETGSWLNMELTDAWGKILDTTTNAELLSYKAYLLDTTNMILVKSSSITDINFYINTKQPMSAALQQVLAQKPLATIQNSNLKTQLFFISKSSIQVKFSGIFEVMGQFMQCKLE